MSWVDYYINAAKVSQWHSYQWVRYLNKAIQRDAILLSDEDVRLLLSSKDLTRFQKVFLELAVEEGTSPWELTVSLSEPAKLSSSVSAMLEALGIK
ncbi:MAG: hypothetical protein LBS41_03380 [Streptococcaceae bacterium]|jgi:hypothetical protein|nr:hypothetical protein [Streptococcaceae bacterium]